MVLIQTNEFATPGQTWYLRTWTPEGKAYRFTWTDNRKDAHNFKTMDNPDFLLMLDFMASEYWHLNITYVTPKKMSS